MRNTSNATFEITSFEFMLNAVPAPEFIISTTNWSTCFPDKILSQAETMAFPRFVSIAFVFIFATAADRFIITNDLIKFS